MGILNWRLWDRLDDLDRRTGVRRDPTERWAKGMPLMFAVFAVGFAVNALIYLVQARWTMAIVEGVLALVAGLASLSLLRSHRRRLSGGQGLLTPQSSPTGEAMSDGAVPCERCAGHVKGASRARTQRPYAEEVRWVFALSTSAIITAGAVYAVQTNPSKFDANFFGLLLTALLPSLVYLLFVRSPRSAMVCGALLLGVTLLGWAFVLDDDAMRGVGAVLAFPVTLALATGFAIHDRATRELRS